MARPTPAMTCPHCGKSITIVVSTAIMATDPLVEAAQKMLASHQQPAPAPEARTPQAKADQCKRTGCLHWKSRHRTNPGSTPAEYGKCSEKDCECGGYV